ncbi:hypothetical protein EV188_102834 [Actinomycetospora succinea]|uniref:SCO6045-like C-terminal domain-containing protein n=1 Tax=Actinomycetospora succinea TaxID=663603 RepID=A0A4R6VIT8_9PSEU|nr:hypothetical protein [Actinomycetospora succinea]TDQ63177.1 hypothetical protein EV188_102834 [Actinomycetospora succinea]
MSREDLARRQAELLAALVAGGPAPSGVDPARVALEADALRAKRRRVLARLLPAEVHDAPGQDLGRRLDAWIAAHPRREGTSMRADTDAFVAALRADGALPRGLRAMRHRWRSHSAHR